MCVSWARPRFSLQQRDNLESFGNPPDRLLESSIRTHGRPGRRLIFNWAFARAAAADDLGKLPLAQMSDRLLGQVQQFCHGAASTRFLSFHLSTLGVCPYQSHWLSAASIGKREIASRSKSSLMLLPTYRGEEDPMGIIRHADAGHEEAIRTADERGVVVPRLRHDGRRVLLASRRWNTVLGRSGSRCSRSSRWQTARSTRCLPTSSTSLLLPSRCHQGHAPTHRSTGSAGSVRAGSTCA
jgi:hypothetical protein